MAEEEKPATLPEKEVGLPRSQTSPRASGRAKWSSSAEAQVVPADSPAGGPTGEKEEVTVTEVSPEVKNPSSAGKVCLS